MGGLGEQITQELRCKKNIQIYTEITVDSMEKTFVCIVCPNGCTLHAAEENGAITVTGNRCPKGEEYAKAELTNPVRTLTTSVATVFPDRPVLPVRTSGAIPKDAIMPAATASATRWRS